MEKSKRLADELMIAPVLAEILVRRNIESFDGAKLFFRPTFDALHDPFRFDGMQLAVDRILGALERNERILIYGDYDVDGTNGVALLLTFLRRLHADVQYFIPNRMVDGYGLSQHGLDRVRSFGARLLISVDCGITAAAQVDYAQSLGMDVIICDHHEPADQLPNAVAVLDALKPACMYPFKSLCGCGVAFKLIQALAHTNDLSAAMNSGEELPLLPFLQYVALATLADIVPLTGENRILVKLGLELINSKPLPGIRALANVAGLELGRINAGQVVFVLAPRINAVGRLGDAARAVELLTCDSYERALVLARVLESENLQRRKIDEETFAQAQVAAEQLIAATNPRAIILHDGGWHPGVIGIVASRIVEKHYRPSIMLTTADGVAKGSARSVSGFNIHEALKQCAHTLIQFGGHKFAAGLTVELDRVPEFIEAFQAVADKLLTEELLTPKLNIDADLQLEEVTPKFVRVLSQFAPFGPENLRPVFAARNVEIYGTPKIVGKNHLRLKVRNNGHIVDAIGFNMGEHLSQVQGSGTRVNLAFSLDEGDFHGEMTPQLKLRDIKANDDPRR